jgi:hypothetical protein
MAAPSSPTAPISTCVRPTYSCSCTKTHPASGTAPLVPLLLHRASPTLLLLTRDVDVVGGEAAKVEITVSPASLALFSSECGGCWCGHRRLTEVGGQESDARIGSDDDDFFIAMSSPP